MHVGIIMDGNGRWAKSRHRPRLFGHRAGVRAIRPVLDAFHARGVHILTLYAFSTENWRRPDDEVRGLMRLLGETIDRETDELHANGIQIRAIGDRGRLGGKLQEKIRMAEEKTRENGGAILNVAINYGSRHEIVEAFQDAVRDGTDPLDLTEDVLASHLYTKGLPDPDLIIRTGGEYRLSNFLLWQAAYAELFVTPTLWPDFGAQDIDAALEFFAGRERRFGTTSDQVAATGKKHRA